MPGQVGTMAGADAMRERIEAHPWPRGGVEVVRANRGYTLYSRRTGGQVARLRPTGKSDDVQVLWWRREAWAEIEAAVERATAYWNEHRHPFVWGRRRRHRQTRRLGIAAVPNLTLI